MGKLKDKINYIEQMTKEIVIALKQVDAEIDKEKYIYLSPSRAKFNRLRVELGKELIEIKNIIYK